MGIGLAVFEKHFEVPELHLGGFLDEVPDSSQPPVLAHIDSRIYPLGCASTRPHTVVTPSVVNVVTTSGARHCMEAGSNPYATSAERAFPRSTP